MNDLAFRFAFGVQNVIAFDSNEIGLLGKQPYFWYIVGFVFLAPMRLFITLLFLLFFFIGTVCAQPIEHTLDSLRKELAHARTDTDRVKAMYKLGLTHLNRNLDSSRWYAEQGLQLARKEKYVQGELNSRELLSFTFSERDIPRTVQLDLENLRLAQQINNRRQIKWSFMGLGTTQFYLENYQQAIAYYRQAKKIALEDKDMPSAANASGEIGLVYLTIQNYDSARYYLTLAKKEGPPGWQTPFYYWSYWGRLFEAEKKPAMAKLYFRQSLSMYKEQQNLRGQGFVSSWFSELLWKQNQPDSSILMAKDGLRAGQLLPNSRIIFTNSRLLANYYQTLGRPDSAYKYQTIMLVARDSLFSQLKINQIQTRLIGEQQRVQRLEEEKSQFESRVKMYGLLGIVSVLALLAAILYHNNRQKQRTNGELRTLNHEIEQQKEEIEAQRDHLEDTLTELQSTQAQLIQKEKLASLGELTAGIAHEIQNPLNFVNNFSEVSTELIDELREGPFQQLPDKEKDYAEEILGDLSSNLKKINHHGERASSIVKGMLEHSRTDSGERRPTDLNALADEYLKIAYHGLRAKNKNFNCELVTDFDPTLELVVVAPQEIGRVLLNLYNNAFYAVHQRQQQADGDYQPTVRVSTSKISSGVELRVKDNGIGIPESIKAKIFQPFFTTKPTGEGTGLGLSLSYDIISKGHGGTLEVSSQEGLGTTFIVLLPPLLKQFDRL